MPGSLEKGEAVLGGEMGVGRTQESGFWNSSKSEFQDHCSPSCFSFFSQAEEREGEGWKKAQTMGIVPR